MALDCCMATLDPPYARHALDCPVSPLRRIMRVGSAEYRHLNPHESVGGDASVLIWLSHAESSGTPCWCVDCAYVDAHLDDEPA